MRIASRVASARWVWLLILAMLVVFVAPLPVGGASIQQPGSVVRVEMTAFVGNGTWSQAGTAPFNRSQSAVAYDVVADRVVLFGGLDGLVFERDTWSYNPSTAVWTNVTGTGGPSARVGASMVFDSAVGRVILFGGEWWTWDPSGGIYWGGVSTDTWSFTSATDTWTQLHPPTAPPGRAHAAMVYDPQADRTLLFGGYNGSAYFNDTWTFDYVNDTWTNLTNSIRPSSRLGAAMTYDASVGRTILFGGADGNGALGDTWWFDATSRVWTPQVPSTGPSPRYLSGFVFDPANGLDVLFGGFPSNAETWIYQAAPDAWTPLFPALSPPGAPDLALVYVASASSSLLVSMRDGKPTETWWYTAPLSPPSAPLDVSATQLFAGVQILWTRPLSDGGSPISGYRIYRGTSPGGEVFLSAVGSGTSFTDASPPSTGNVYYLVSAVNALGEGPLSSEVALTLGATPSLVGDLWDLGRIWIAVGILALVFLAVVALALVSQKRTRPPVGPA